jgi:hypothetical protein
LAPDDEQDSRAYCHRQAANRGMPPSMHLFLLTLEVRNRRPDSDDTFSRSRASLARSEHTTWQTGDWPTFPRPKLESRPGDEKR